MKVFRLERYLPKVEAMVRRKAKAVRNNPNRWDYYDSQKLDYYRAHLELLIQNKKNGEDYYIKF